MLNQPDMESYYRQLIESMCAEIARESDEQILGSEIDELAQYYYDKFALAPIEEDPSAKENFDVQDYLQDIPAHKRERGYSGEGVLHNFPSQRIVVEVPIVYNNVIATLSRLRGSTYTVSYSDADFKWSSTAISRTIETKGYGFEFDERQMASAVQESINRIRQTVGWKNEGVRSGNARLLESAKNYIEQRKAAINRNKEKITALTKTINIPLKKKPSAGAQAVRVAHSPLVQRVKPKPNLPEEYVLDEVKVNDIVELLDNQARSFESTPAALKKLGEEDLRDIFLSNLNSVFAGDATGETFSKNGKTDIYLKISKGNILIAECKIWGGKILYEETIDQLRGYLTWRHNYGVMITFVRNKDFTKVLAESETNIKSHPSYVSGFQKINETHFVSNHRIDDSDKEVKIHHLFYHLYDDSK